MKNAKKKPSKPINIWVTIPHYARWKGISRQYAEQLMRSGKVEVWTELGQTYIKDKTDNQKEKKDGK
jgi:hypothetical protein